VQPTGKQTREFSWFLIGQASWFSAFGVQAVLFPYLIVNVLLQGPEQIGLAQMAMMGPSLLLMLVGGVVADASDLRKLLASLQCVAALPPLALGCALLVYGPTFPALIAYALCYGACQAFVLPARDALLSRVAGSDVQRAVTSATALQFASQIVGFVIGGSARFLGAPVLLFSQAVLLILGALAALRLSPAPSIPSSEDDRSQGRPRLGDIGSAITEVLQSRKLLPVVILMIGVGLFFIPVFMVVIPVMVRDFYAGSSVELAMVNGAFVLGTITSTVVLMRRAAVQRQGRAILVALIAGATLIGLFSLQPPQVLFYVMIYCFGSGAGVVMSIGRTIAQESARPSHRARVLAVYNLGFMGAAPIGAFALGQLGEVVGILAAARYACGGMFTLLALTAWRTGFWKLRRDG